jgi:hypothetical protein
MFLYLTRETEKIWFWKILVQINSILNNYWHFDTQQVN